jgi:hypothetical protein
MGGVVSSIANVFTGANSTRQAGIDAANQMREASREGAAAAAFRPVGMTTRFGTSQFTREVDPETGIPYISSAGYTASPELQAIQNRLFGQFGRGLTFAEEQQLMASPIAGGAQRLFQLGGAFLPDQVNRAPSAEAVDLAAQYRRAAEGLMPTSFAPEVSPEALSYADQLSRLASTVTPTTYDPTAAAQQYIEQQRALLRPEQESQFARLRSNVFATGRGGLGVNTGTGGAPTSPEMQAYFNSLARQERELTATATDVARSRLAQDIGLGTQLGGQSLATRTAAQELARQNMLQNLGTSLGFRQNAFGTLASAEDLARQRLMQDISYGAGLFGTGGSLLGQQAQVGAGAYAPFQTQLGTAGQVEQMSQMPFQLGVQLGQAAQPGASQAAQLYTGGQTQAAQTQYGATAAANAANAGFWSGLISGGAQAYGMSRRGTGSLFG